MSIYSIIGVHAFVLVYVHIMCMEVLEISKTVGLGSVGICSIVNVYACVWPQPKLDMHGYAYA
jgi:hypothetical protein